MESPEQGMTLDEFREFLVHECCVRGNNNTQLGVSDLYTCISSHAVAERVMSGDYPTKANAIS